jgi:N-methylhydantoinase A/oxoprolinase/acetone carboxylase beta subunit
VFTGDRFTDTTLVERTGVVAGREPEPPAIVTEYSGTTVVPAGWTMSLRHGHLMLERGDR